MGAGLAIGHNLLWAAEDVLKKEIVILAKDDQATGLKDVIYCGVRNLVPLPCGCL